MKIDNLETASLVELYNAQGAVVLKVIAESDLEEFNVDTFPKGIYIVRITQNGRAKSFKVIKN